METTTSTATNKKSKTIIVIVLIVIILIAIFALIKNKNASQLNNATNPLTTNSTTNNNLGSASDITQLTADITSATTFDNEADLKEIDKSFQ